MKMRPIELQSARFSFSTPTERSRETGGWSEGGVFKKPNRGRQAKPRKEQPGRVCQSRKLDSLLEDVWMKPCIHFQDPMASLTFRRALIHFQRGTRPDSSCRFAQSSKKKIPRNRSIIQKMRREAGARVHRVPGEHCIDSIAFRTSWTAPVLQSALLSLFTVSVLVIGPQSSPTGTGTPPDASVHNYRASQQKVESVRLPAPVSRSSPLCCTGHRQLRSGIKTTIRRLLGALLSALPEL
ncbi:hypothetical protein EYF80_001445 [Liparis tanakae]|uniref:Uncharacterized protein n=1 Tax=Liparis tanakae TaxID=230148 RepID=A0A4Z2JDD1_9TELE|nr:hypothetical protein EYF80_001445 [Liparis tanakae]